MLRVLCPQRATRSLLYFSRMFSAESLVVHHDQDNREFFIKLNEGGEEYKAFLLYEEVGKKTVDLCHTEVPPVFRGKGVASQLVKAALKYVMDKNLKMKLSCTYCKKFVDDNPDPEYSSRVVD